MSVKKALNGVLLVVACSSLARPLLAVDPFEAPQDAAPFGDDDNQTNVTLTTGLPQTHDLDQAGGGDDQDWMVVPTIVGHSYEARISASNIGWSPGGCGSCAQIDRVDASGAIISEDVAIVNDGPGTSAESYDKSVRWFAGGATTAEFLRVSGGSFFTENASSVYTVRFWDTTYSIPRWNNTSGQSTVILINSLIQTRANGIIRFFNAAGAYIVTVVFVIEPNQLFVLNTSTVGYLGGQSGHAYVAHDAGYGGLAGKAVALDPATGFSFDTPLVPILD